MKILYSAIRNIFKKKSFSQLNRLMMTSTTLKADVDKATEQLKRNPYYEKYAKKIATLQKTSPDEFLSRVETRVNEKKPKHNMASNLQYSSLLEPKKQLGSTVEIQDEPLCKIMKIDLLTNKEASEITEIWSKYHMESDFISAAIPSELYDEMNANASKYPTFLFPIPRSQGYEFIMCQFFKNSVYYTPLLHYQVHKENAPECLKIVHYTEFKETKGIVLMRGEFDKNVINVQEAQCLANQLQLYYSQNDSEKIELLEAFTRKPDHFKHMELIKQIENISLLK